MKTTFIAVLILLSSYSSATLAWEGSNSYQRSCSQFLSIWFPSHPRACPAKAIYEELAPGLDVSKSKQAFDWRRHIVFSDITLQNNSGFDIPAGSKLIVSYSTLPLKNADGYTDDTQLPYFLIDNALASGESLMIRADFGLRFKQLNYSLDFEFGEVSDGIASIFGEATVTQTLTAEVSDPDGISNSVAYQWHADGIAIPGAANDSYILVAEDEGKAITVTATYTDDINFNEVVTSQATTPVAARPDNIEGIVNAVGTKLIGEILIASVADANGVSGSIDYQWFANGIKLNGETTDSLILGSEFTGQTITVMAMYSDNYFYDELLVSSSNNVVVTTIVNDQVELLTAIDNANDNDWIGLAGTDYANMPELSLGAVTLTLAEDSPAVISGATCIHMPTNKAALVGLTFDALDMLVGSTCDSNGDSSIYIDADNIEIVGNSFLGEVGEPSSSTYNWISAKDSYALIERNLFANKNTDKKGSAISFFNNTSTADQYGHVIQYNLFKDFVGGNEGSAHAIQVGRSTGTGANGDGAHVIRYNRFENIQTKQRLIKVQSSANMIYNNTIEDSLGNIALENGERNTVANNIILPTGEDDASNDSGISFTPYGHTITGNYIAGLRTTSSQRAALLANSERYGDLGNAALTVSPVTISGNTILNSRQPINLSSNGCIANDFIIRFDSNLIANGEDPTLDVSTATGTDYGFEGRTTNGEGRNAVIDNCALSAGSSHNNEHYYSSSLSKNGSFAFFNGAGNIGSDDAQSLADIVAGNDGLFEGTGIDAGIGASTSALVYLTNTDVGPDSSYTAPAVTTTYDAPISFDLSTWNITFPDGSSEKDPNWLLDGNTFGDDFYYDADGAMVFKSDNITAGTTTNSSFPRSEFREMLRGPEQDPKPSGFPDTQGVNKNNWVFSSSTQANQFKVGGVDGTMNACLKMDSVSFDGDSGQIGRVIVGQIHASDDEPAKLYYRKLPGNELGSIYFRHEVPNVGDITYELIGDSSSNAPNPIDGVALGEVWCYEISVVGQELSVAVSRDNKPTVSRTITMVDNYIDDWMYFKAGIYNQNNTGPDSFAQATFYSLTKSHDEPPTDPGTSDGGSDDGGSDGGGAGEGVPGDAVALQAAINAASDGDIIEIEGTFSDTTLNVGTNGISIVPAPGTTAVFTGATCIYVTGSDVRLSGLVFRDIALVDGSFCQSNGEASIALNGNRTVLDNNLFDGDAANPISDGEDTHNWVSLKRSDALIERNTFQNKRGLLFDNSAEVEGSFISVFITGSGINNTIQYNVFKDMTLTNQSSAYAIQLGRSSGSNATDDGFNLVAFNRFDNIDSKTRVIKVQGSSNVIHGNTIIDSQGMISLEDGQNNVVSNNVILPNGEDSNDGGIAFAPFGHVIINNYIAGSRTTSSERGGLLLNWNETGSGNDSLAPSAVMVRDNSIINTKQAIHFGSKGCGNQAFIINADNNLVANGVSGIAALEGTSHDGRPAIRDACTLDPSSTFNNNSLFTASQSTSGTFDITRFGTGNMIGPDAGAELSSDTKSLVLGTGTEQGKGADTTLLNVIEESDAGVGSATFF